MIPKREILFGAVRARVAAVAFDKDGTLLATEPFWRELYRLRFRLVAEEAGTEAAEEWRETMGVSPDLVFDRGGPFTLGSFEDEGLVTAVVLYRHTRRPWDECRRRGLEITARSNEMLDLRRAVQPLPGAVEAVTRLKAAGLAVGVVTSDNVERTVASMELAGLPASVWDFVLGAESVPRHKPAPDMIHRAAEQTGIAPEAFAVVGDSRVDMMMAKSAGALAVGVRELGRASAGVEELADVVLDGVYEIRVP